MSPPGRPKGESLSAQHEGAAVSPPGRPEGDFRTAQREGTAVTAVHGPALQTVLAFDYGVRRTGVAVGQRMLGTARPLATVDALGDARFAPIERLITEWQPDALVIGVPRHPDGAAHENTRLAQRFGRQLHGRFRLPVHEVDERYSTVEVQSRGARDADAAAAALLLEQFFNELALKELSA